MKRLGHDIIRFLHNQGFVVVSTIDKTDRPHSSCKGIVKMTKGGKIYLLDLYKEKTFENLKRNKRVSITAVDEHRFEGFCLKGKARVIKEEKLKDHILDAWETRISQRITQRVLRNIVGEKSGSRHPEVFLPRPEYLIVMEVEEVVDLTPHHIKRQIT